MKPESLEVSLTKLILIVSIMFSLGAIFGAVGYLIKNRQVVRPLPQVLTTLEPTATAVPSIKDETADWKTYRNEEYGFEIKYPKDWYYSEEAQMELSPEALFKLEFCQSAFYDNGCKYTHIDGYDFPITESSAGFVIFSVDHYPESIMKQFYENSKIVKTFSGMEVNVKENHRLAFWKDLSQNNFYNISLYKPEDQKIFNQIFASFRFIEKDRFFSCGTSTITDIDNNIYNTVKIDSQCWLKQNLKVTKNPAGEPITRYCYGNNPKICDTDGGLYDWNTTMNNSTTEGVQGICPNGWHVPKDSEWYVLENYLKDDGKTCDRARGGMWDSVKSGGWDCNSAGSKLKSGGSSGFDGILAGYRDADSVFYYQTSYAYFWSSTQNGLNAWGRFLNLGLPHVLRNRYNKSTDFSVRCLKD